MLKKFFILKKTFRSFSWTFRSSSEYSAEHSVHSAEHSVNRLNIQLNVLRHISSTHELHLVLDTPVHRGFYWIRLGHTLTLTAESDFTESDSGTHSRSQPSRISLNPTRKHTHSHSRVGFHWIRLGYHFTLSIPFAFAWHSSECFDKTFCKSTECFVCSVKMFSRSDGIFR